MQEIKANHVPVIVIVSFLLCCQRIAGGGAAAATTRPKHAHVIIIMADDMGFNDVSYHGSNQFITPNIDALAYQGVILNRHYAPPLCTPSRSSFMTGKYPFNIGMQHLVILSDEPWGLGLEEKIMPQYFKEAGYRTHLVGKWHLGFYKEVHTPVYRGFDSYFGYLGPHIDYYDHSIQWTDKPYARALDLRRGLEAERRVNGTYATEMFTNVAIDVIDRHPINESLFLMVNHLAPHSGNENNPLQAPQEEIEKFRYIKDPQRRVYAAMVSILDREVGRLITALKAKKILQDTVILFFSDNGAPSEGFLANQGSNYPLRGQKQNPFDGGIRTPAILWTPRLEHPHRVHDQIFSVADWLPTLLSAAGIHHNVNGLDGMDQWESLSTGSQGIRSELPVNIDEGDQYGILLNGTYKLINGTISDGVFDRWMGQLDDERQPNYLDRINEGSRSFKKSLIDIDGIRHNATVTCSEIKNPRPCFALKSPCLFDIFKDPCEQDNLAEEHPEIVQAMMTRLIELYEKRQPMMNRKGDPKADPALFNNSWTWWIDSTDSDFNILRRLPRHQSFLDARNDSYFFHWFALSILTILILFLALYVFLLIPSRHSKSFQSST